MARQAGEFIENQFSQGLITEATGYRFPPKAAIEAWNTRFEKTGQTSRRFGYDSETGNDVTLTFSLEGVVKSYIWKNPGTFSGQFLVLQKGGRLSFFAPNGSGNYEAAGAKSFTVNLNLYKTTGTNEALAEREAAFASADGRLYVVHPRCEALQIEYDEDTDTITVSEITIEIRDFEGLDDGLDPDERPTTLSTKHHYNLKNQGWYPEEGEIYAYQMGSAENVIDAYYTYLTQYPSNSEVWWNYKQADGFYNPTLSRVYSYGNSLASRGHYIYNVFDIDRKDASGITNLPSGSNESTTRRFSAVGFYAGRVWYGGLDDRIFYSQIVESAQDVGRCYQKNDPTSETLSDLLDTDGGVINILGLNKAIAFFQFGNALLVFSENGIWAVSGSGAEGTGFVATDFAVKKIASVPMANDLSLVDVEGSPIWWNLEGIWTVQAGNGGFQVTSLSEDTIKTFIQTEIPVDNRNYVQGAFNPSTRTVQWLFRGFEANNVEEKYRYNKLLEFNIGTGAFYPFEWDIGDAYFNTIFCVAGITAEQISTGVVVDDLGVTVTDSGGNNVTVSIAHPAEYFTAKFKYLSLDTGTANTCYFLEESETTYLDFASILGAGVNYTSYFVSGALVINNGKFSNVEYITVYANIEGTPSCYVQARWDWSNSGASGKWSTTQQVYSANRTSRDVSRKRLLIRGSGPVVQFKFSSEQGKPFYIIGWNGLASSDSVP